MKRRRRTFLLLGTACVFALIAATMVSRYVEGVGARVGPMVSVLEVRNDIPRGTVLNHENAAGYLSARAVAAQYAPRRSFDRIEQVLGYNVKIDVPAGTYLSPGELTSEPHVPAPDIRRGERAVDVAVHGAGGLGSTLGPGSRVDVVISREEANGGGRTHVALENAEVLGARPSGAGAGSPDTEVPDAIVTLRATVRQAVYLTSAQNFAKEIRLLVRAPGDRARADAGSVSSSDLG